MCVRISAATVRREVLQPAAAKFKCLGGLKDTTPHKACLMLVESLRYATFDGYASSDPVNYGALTLVNRRGVLVDTADYRESVGDEDAIIVNSTGGPLTVQDRNTENVRAEGNDVPSLVDASSARTAIIEGGAPEAASAVTTYTACYRKDVGRYRISSAMVVVLTTLMASAFEENFSHIGEKAWSTRWRSSCTLLCRCSILENNAAKKRVAQHHFRGPEGTES
jgi:hypothetical protein